MTIQIPQNNTRPNIILYAASKMAPITLDIGNYTAFTILDANGKTVYTTPDDVAFWKYLKINY